MDEALYMQLTIAMALRSQLNQQGSINLN